MKRLPASPWIPVAASLLGLGAMLLLAYFWHSASHHLGWLYSAVRAAETLGAWRWTEWGAYFDSRPSGQPYAFLAIFKSSVPFGVVFAALTGIIGVLAYRKVRTQHLDVLLAEPSAGLSTINASGSLYGSLPHLRADAFRIPTIPLRLPTENPFAPVADLRDRVQVAAAVADLSWPEAVVFVITLDALAPMTNRTPLQQVNAILLRTITLPASAKASPSEPRTPPEPSNRDRAMITLTLIDVVTRLDDGRDTTKLDKAHNDIQEAHFTHDALAALVEEARKVAHFPMERTSWLRFVDPLLNDRLAHADQGNQA